MNPTMSYEGAARAPFFVARYWMPLIAWASGLLNLRL